MSLKNGIFRQKKIVFCNSVDFCKLKRPFFTENSSSQQNGDPMTINGVEMSVLPHFQTYHQESNENHNEDLDLEL